MTILDRVKHWLGIHKYVYIKRLSFNSHQLGCKYCCKRFCMNTSVRLLVTWDQELEDFYNDNI